MLEKLYPKNQEIGKRFLNYLVEAECTFAVSNDGHSMEIRGSWSASTLSSLVAGAGLDLDRDFDRE